MRGQKRLCPRRLAGRRPEGQAQKREVQGSQARRTEGQVQRPERREV